MPPLEYYTYGGFDATVSGLTRLALIMSDASFKGVAALFAVVGGVFAGYQLFTGKDGWQPLVHWFMGCILFIGVVADASSTLQVYDPVKNKSQSVGSLPTAVVVSLGAMNLIERGFIDMISTSGDPLGYQQSAGGVGLNLIYQAATKNLAAEQYMEMNLHQFVGDCWGFMYGTAATIDLNDIVSNNTDLLAELAKGSTPGMWLENWYTPADHSGSNGGTTMYCDTAWTELNTYYSDSATYAAMTNSICASGGAFDPADAAQKAQCQATMNGWVSMMATGNSSGGPTGEDFIRQVYLSNQLVAGINQMDPNYKASQDFVATSAGGENFAANWGPQMRAGMFMVALMITPLLLLFVATPMWSTVMPFIFGLYLLPTVWGICDASLNEAIISLSNQVFQEVKANKLGLNAIAFAQDDSMKMLTYLNYARAGGLALATMIISSLFKWGAGASKWGGDMSGKMQSVGGTAGEGAFTMEGQTAGELRALEGPTKAMGMSDAITRYGHEGYGKAKAADMSAGVGGTLGASTGYASLDRYIEEQAHADAVEKSRKGGAGAGQTIGQAHDIGAMGGAEAVGKLDAMEARAAIKGTTVVGESKELAREQGILESAATAGKYAGISKVAEANNMDVMQAAMAMNEQKAIEDMTDTAERKKATQEFADKHAGGDLVKGQEILAGIKAARPVGEAKALVGEAGKEKAAALAEKQAGTETGKKISDVKRVENLQKALGLGSDEQGRQKAQDFETNGGAFNKAEMAAINKQGFHLTPGMRMAEGAKHAYFDDKGNLLGMKVGGLLNPDQAKAAGKEARAQGLNNVADKLEAMGKAGKSVDVSGNIGAGKGGWAGMKFTAGGSADSLNNASEQNKAEQIFTNKAEYTFGEYEKGEKGFSAGGVQFMSGTATQRGGEWTIDGTSAEGRHVTMKGRGGGVMSENGKFSGVQGLVPTEVTSNKIDNRKDEHLVQAISKMVVDRESTVKMSNLGNIMAAEGVDMSSTKDIAQWGKEHEGTLAAYGMGANVMENFTSLMKFKDTVGKAGSMAKPPQVKQVSPPGELSSSRPQGGDIYNGGGGIL